MLVLDLFSGSGSATDIFVKNGWKRIEIDILKGNDILSWTYQDIKEKVNVIWASPPCQEYSKTAMPFKKYRNIVPDHTLLLKTLEIINYFNPDIWVIENVRGAEKYFNDIIGSKPKKCGSRYLWGNFPIFCVNYWDCCGKFPHSEHGTFKVKPEFKGCNLAYHKSAAERSKIPAALSRNFFNSVKCYYNL